MVPSGINNTLPPFEQHLLGALSRSGVHNQAVVPYAQTDSDSRFRISANEKPGGQISFNAHLTMTNSRKFSRGGVDFLLRQRARPPVLHDTSG